MIDTHVFHVGEKHIVEHVHQVYVDDAILHRNEEEIHELRRWPKTAVDLRQNAK